MYNKKFYFIFVTFLLCNVVVAKKLRRNKRPHAEDDSTPQPNVVTYSTFGFNDVGIHDGFVPSSPDYASYLSNFNQDSSSRLYAPAFPTAQDNYPSPSQSSQTFSFDDDPQASILQYHPSPTSYMNSPSQDNEPQSQNNAPEIYGRNAGDENAPIYGTKLSSKNRNKHFSQFNNTDFNIFGSESNPSDNKYSSFHEVHSSFENKPTSYDEQPSKNYQYNFNYATSHPTPTNDNDEYLKPAPSNTQHSLNFPKVVDFTKYKQFYPTELSTTTKAPNIYKPLTNNQNENAFFKNFEELSTKFPITFKEKDAEDGTEKDPRKPSFPGSGYAQNYLNYPNNENVFKDSKYNFDHKDKFKYDQWASTNFTNDFKTWKNPIKGYQYSTNYSNMNFEFDFSGGKKPMNDSNDEILPASSNVVDFTNYQFPEHDFSSFKKLPGYRGHENDDYTNAVEAFKSGYKYDPEEYVKSLYSTVPTTTTLWGSSYKNPEFSSYKPYGKKPIFSDDIGDEIVHIPKRPYGSKYGYGGKPIEWSSYNSHKPYKPKKQLSSWNKEVSTRFKSEEDLLGLRTHDTSHPSYLPTYKPEASSFTSDYDYKKLVEKWRQSYLRAKYKDAGLHDFEGYSSEPKPLHVPVPKPYAIEVPHPVIVPVPQPYPVRVPIPKPVAVPVIRELTVPVEKPVPYPVYKNVPYPIEKPMPYTVEKEVQVPVMKPYPVPVPHIRPVFHHSRPKEDMDGAIDEDDDYFPRPEAPKKTSYAKRPRRPKVKTDEGVDDDEDFLTHSRDTQVPKKTFHTNKLRSTRNRSRRPSRTYTERNRRRWPTRRPTDSRYRRPELPSSY